MTPLATPGRFRSISADFRGFLGGSAGPGTANQRLGRTVPGKHLATLVVLCGSPTGLVLPPPARHDCDMAKPPTTVLEQIALSYSLLGGAHAVLQRGEKKYSRVDYMIRAKLRKGLVDGTMKMRSLYDDERFKMTMPQACYYCGSTHKLSVDHLIPKMRGGPDASDNLVWACRSCNSSKRGRDMLVWMESKEQFPPLLLLRRYIKIVAQYCEKHGYMDTPLDRLDDEPDMPFDVRRLPTKYPPLDELVLWVYPAGTDANPTEPR